MIKRVHILEYLNKKEIIKSKAYFMIFLIICSSIYLSLSFQEVEAQSSRQVSSGQQACCEVTKTGDSCVYTSKSNCDTQYKNSLTTCENTNYCSLGTCIYDKDGECFANTPKSLCDKNNGVWSNEDITNIKQCQRGCCQLSNECSFVTQTKCKSITSQFPNVNTIFDSSVQTEAQCVDKCRSEEKGACVLSDSSCTFTTRNNCLETEAGINSTLKTGFHVNVLCSNPLLGTNCARQQKTTCLNEKVYWIDSCGNPENVYDSNKDNSYNKGFVLDPIKSCKLSKPNDPNCGNCDYSQGNLCGKSPSNVNMAYGDYSCNDLSCKKTTTNIASPDSSGIKQSGESWCLYDARVGFGQDVVGSRHYRDICLNGEEVIDPCKDFREEICIQGVSGAIQNFNLGQAFNVGNGYLESACRANRFKECNSCNEIGGTCGGECNNLQGNQRVACCRQTCCNDIENKDCYYMKGGVTDFGGICVPMVPPGLRFWEGGKGGGSKEGTQTGASSVCNEASISCEVKFVRGGTARIGIGGLGTPTDWECVKNCQCLDKNWVKSAAAQCSARGDCGAKYNIQGVFTSGGFSEDTKYTLTQKDFEDWNTISRQSLRKDDPTNLGAFFERTWPSFLVSLGLGLTSLFTAGLSAASFAHGAFLGIKTLGTIFPGYHVEQPLLSAGLGQTGTGQALLGSARALGASTTNAGTNTISGEQLITLKFGDKILTGTSNSFNLVATEKGGYVIEAAGEGGAKGTMELTSQQSASIIEESVGYGFWVGALQVLSVLAWLYTIYSLVDIIFKDSKTETVSVSCNPWEAPKGGEDCQKCNENGKTCSEYRCRSLGSLCRLVNEGTNEEKCVAQTAIDVNSPIIKAIKPKNLEIEEAKNQGYIVKTLIKPFTPVDLGISTDEPSKCKFDINSSLKYENMRFNFGDSLFRYNHTMLFSLPSELQQEQALKLTNGGKYSLYVKCIDNNDNANNRDYYIRFEIDSGPDLTAPKIEVTSIKNNGYISNDATQAGLDIFVNEPSQCKWDSKDTDYDLMSNNFICARSGLDVTPIYQGLYRCSTILTNLQKGKNNYYFRCKDKPTATEGRNVNKESYEFKLIKTEKLVINSVDPKGKVYVANPKISVKTSVGAESGVSICGYSNNQNALISNIPLFAQTNATEHTQQFRNLKKGAYTYYVTCIDKAGNTVKDSLQFEVVSDNLNKAVISHIYKDSKQNILTILTTEDSTCQYSNAVFNFGEGTPMTNPNTKQHGAALLNVYHVTCKDIFGNQESAIVYP